LSARAPSAFAQLRTLFHRLVEPGTIEDAYGHDLFTEHTAAQAATHATSTRAEGLVQRLRRHFTEFMADNHLDPKERRILAQDQRELAQATAQTTAHLEQLR
ncbi:MAG: hypothetical protein WC054_07005, partial [Candidatus Nanopelagicales bacterium]